jgi:hypothetical protein
VRSLLRRGRVRKRSEGQKRARAKRPGPRRAT